MKTKFNYKWYLKNGYPAPGIENHKLKAFGTFVCGGGSTMGYKLAGYDHLGGVEIDKTIAASYEINHKPKHFYIEDLRIFNKRNDLPQELYTLDLLDGSPPCSNFSMCGSREANWGKAKKFREGQAKQSLEDLVYVYCDTILKLKPKTFILENVKGIIMKNAKAYTRGIIRKLTQGGYKVQVFLLNAKFMGVPQVRQRVFFIGHKKELKFPKLKLSFNNRIITLGEFTDGVIKDFKPLTAHQKKYWKLARNGDCFRNVHEKGHLFNSVKCANEGPLPCITAGGQYYSPSQQRHLTNKEIITAGSFPQDYIFKSAPKYMIGMSVPPVMTANIAYQIYLQWLKKK